MSIPVWQNGSTKAFDFSFTEGLWGYSFRVFTMHDNDEIVHLWMTDSVKVTNNGQPYTPVGDDEGSEWDRIEQALVWAFENRRRRKDSRDVCVEVRICADVTDECSDCIDILELLPPE